MDCITYVNDFSWKALDLVPNAPILERRDTMSALENQHLPVADLAEALRHIRVFKCADVDEQELVLAWDSVRTKSAVEKIESFKYSDIAEKYPYAFLPELVFEEPRGIFDFELEGYTLKVGQSTLSVPWEMVYLGYVPRGLKNFGELMDADAGVLLEDAVLKPRELIFKIHDYHGDNPWVRKETLDFMLAIATENGWFQALNPTLNPLLAFDLISRMPDFHIEDSFHPHPINQSWQKLQKIAKAVESCEIHQYCMDTLERYYRKAGMVDPPQQSDQPDQPDQPDQVEQTDEVSN
ncbi:hypothetical protein [Corynebacterium suranareeae]|uniref:hypothetical protein n=1 Tax=Corynebacterium suranareeae TaxID=2506452 RepID=UPI001E3656DC|nr:hypothetical protein [Corynebacterium suranareeae]